MRVRCSAEAPVSLFAALVVTLTLAVTPSDAQVLYSAGQIGGPTGTGPGPAGETAWDVVVDSSGSVIVVGRYEGTADLDPTSGVSTAVAAGFLDAYVIKLNSAGSLIWAGSFGGPGTDYAQSVAVDVVGNIYVAGLFSDTADLDPSPVVSLLSSSGGMDAFVIKLNGAGSLVWARGIGGPLFDAGRDVAVDGTGEVVVVGEFSDTADFDPGPGTYSVASAGQTDGFVLKLTGGGGFLWIDPIGGAGPDRSEGVATDGSANILAVGAFEDTVDFDPGAGTNLVTSAGASDGFIWKLGGAGALVWAGHIGGPGIDAIEDIGIQGTGDILAAGSYMATADLDPGAGTQNLTSAGLRDAFVSKLNGAGNLLWAETVGGTGDDRALALASESGGRVHVMGGFEGTVDLDPGGGISSVTTVGSADAFVLSLDDAGQFAGGLGFGGVFFEFGRGIAAAGNGSVYAVGFFGSTVDFDPGPGIFNLTSFGHADGFLFHGTTGPVVALQSGQYCIHGVSSNQIYSWWLDVGCDNANKSLEPSNSNAGPVTPTGASAAMLASDFALSISSNLTAKQDGISASASSNCFQLQVGAGVCTANVCTAPGLTSGQACTTNLACNFTGPLCLLVGIVNQPPACLVTTSGCPYNPVITLGPGPPSATIPTLSNSGMVLYLLLLLAAGAFLALRGRTGATR